MKKLILATHNLGKVRELKQMLGDLPVEVRSLHDFPELGEIPETGTTFQENARVKAETVFAHTGLPVIADDSGLEVDALSGAPGVYSARYAGEKATDEDNNRKLLQALSDVPESGRGAQFRSVICAIFGPGKEVFTEGVCRGRIGFGPRGDNGFGYDPLFLVEPDYQRTMAELSLAEKNAISHRSRAFHNLKPLLVEFLREG
jgi:XTP/dITP diphosphohydrolase